MMPERTASTRPAAPDVQILICTHNRAALLSRTLESLNRCERPDDCRTEIFVVPNACTDGTIDMLRSYADEADERGWLPLRWSEEPVPGKSNALNHAFPLLSAPVVAMVDDDHRVDSGYLRGACAAIRAYPQADLFCGRILPDWDGSEPGWVHDTGRYRIYPLPVPRFDQGPHPKAMRPGTVTPGGGNLFLRRHLFDRVGPFSADFGPTGHNLGGAEDIEWVHRALALDARLQYVPDVVQYHYVDPQRLRLGYLVRKAYERSASVIRLSDDLKGRRSVPLYMFRKAMTYALLAAIRLSPQARRFYLVRLAASLGEIKGFLSLRQQFSRPAAGTARPGQTH